MSDVVTAEIPTQTEQPDLEPPKEAESEENLDPILGPEPPPAPETASADPEPEIPATNDALPPKVEGVQEAVVATTSNEIPAPVEKLPIQEKVRIAEEGALFQTNMMQEAHKAKTKKEKGEKLTDQEKAFLRYERIYSHTQAKGEQNLVTAENGYRGMHFDAQPIFVRFQFENETKTTGEYVATSEDSAQRITEITSRFQDNGVVYFRCNVVGHTKPIDIKASVVLDSVALSGKEIYLKKIGEKHNSIRKVAEAHLNRLENPDTPVSENHIIKEAAIETGLVTTEATAALIDQSNLTSEEKERLKAALAQNNIATPEVLGIVLYKLNNLDWMIQAKNAQIGDLESVIKEKQKILAHLPVNSQAAAQEKYNIDVMEAQLKVALEEMKEIQTLQEMVGEQVQDAEQLTEIIRNAYNSGRTVNLDKAIKENKFEEIFETLIGELPPEHPMKNKYLEIAKKAGKYGGISILALLAIMIMQSSMQNK